MSAADIIAAAGLTIAETMTTPSRPGKKPRPVWEVRGNVAPWEAIFRGLGGRPWRGAFSFFEDPTDGIADALQNEGADATLTGTYRDRREARAERLQEWSEKRERKSAAAFKTARTIADAIPFGQPILVGHHSEKHARRDQARIHSNMSKGCEHADKARDMASRAENITAAAERAIYSDDVDALDRMRERVADLEAERERVKLVNKAVRKHGLQRLTEPEPPFTLTPAEAAELLQLMKLCPYHQSSTRGFPPYHLQNLGGNITRNRARLQEMEDKAAARARVRAALADYCKPADEPEPPAPRELPPSLTPWIGDEVDTVCPDGPACPDPACIAERARRANPVQDVADAISQAEATAAPLADVPFALMPPVSLRKQKQEGLF